MSLAKVVSSLVQADFEGAGRGIEYRGRRGSEERSLAERNAGRRAGLRGKVYRQLISMISFLANLGYSPDPRCIPAHCLLPIVLLLAVFSEYAAG